MCGLPCFQHAAFDAIRRALTVVAMQRPLAMAADCRFAVVDGIGVIDAGALCLVVPILTAGFFGRGRLGPPGDEVYSFCNF